MAVSAVRKQCGIRASGGNSSLATDRLKSKLGTGVNEVSCDYRDSVLYLRGWCNSFYKKQVAQEAVRSVEGVLRVVNRIQVVARTN